MLCSIEYSANLVPRPLLPRKEGPGLGRLARHRDEASTPPDRVSISRNDHKLRIYNIHDYVIMRFRVPEILHCTGHLKGYLPGWQRGRDLGVAFRCGEVQFCGSLILYCPFKVLMLNSLITWSALVSGSLMKLWCSLIQPMMNINTGMCRVIITVSWSPSE